MDAEHALQEALRTADENANVAAWWDIVPHRLAELGYTITRIDPEASAVAELLALERAGKFVALDYTDRMWFVHMRRRPGGGDFVDRTHTAVELLAEVKAVLKEAE